MLACLIIVRPESLPNQRRGARDFRHDVATDRGVLVEQFQPPLRIVAVGAVDELDCQLGFALAHPGLPQRFRPELTAYPIPHNLVTLPGMEALWEADIVAGLIRRGLAVHAFNQRSVAGILDMIRMLGALVEASDRAATSHIQRTLSLARDAVLTLAIHGHIRPRSVALPPLPPQPDPYIPYISFSDRRHPL